MVPKELEFPPEFHMGRKKDLVPARVGAYLLEGDFAVLKTYQTTLQERLESRQ